MKATIQEFNGICENNWNSYKEAENGILVSVYEEHSIILVDKETNQYYLYEVMSYDKTKNEVVVCGTNGTFDIFPNLQDAISAALPIFEIE